MKRAVVIAVVVFGIIGITARQAGAAPERARAIATYASLQQRFYSSASGLYRDSRAGGSESSAAAWSFSQAFAATVAVARIPGVATRYRAAVTARLRELERYWDTQRQPAGYDAAVIHGVRAASPARFFDDNAWIGLDLVDSADFLHDRTALLQAERVFAFVRSGWDTNASNSCPGGVFWTHWRGIADRNAVSTANGAILALRLYRETGVPVYLEWATRMYEWVAGCLTRSDGLIADHIRGDETIDTRAWTYNQGAMIAAGALLYEATGDAAYLTSAQSLAARALASFGDYRSDPPIFVAIFFRDLVLLSQIDGDRSYRAAIQAYADHAWQHSRVSGSGALFQFGHAPTILDQAAMVQIYAALATVG